MIDEETIRFGDVVHGAEDDYMFVAFDGGRNIEGRTWIAAKVSGWNAVGGGRRGFDAMSRGEPFWELVDASPDR